MKMNKNTPIQELICSINSYAFDQISRYIVTFMILYLEAVLNFFFVPRTDIILKTRSTLWLTVIFSAKIFYQVSCKLNQN